MKLINLQERVRRHGAELLIYAAVVAEAYEAAPRFEERAVGGYNALAKSNNVLLKRLQADVTVTQTPDDPYSRHRDMANDVINNKNLRVYTGTDEEHPVLTNDENTILRTVHDYYAHTGPIRKEIAAGKVPARNDFSYRGELNAYLTHTKLAPRAAIPILFTEVAGQISYYLITGGYAPQKAAILDGFDYIHLGKFTDAERQNRFNQLLDEYNNNGIITVNVKGGIDLTKDNANWKMLSRGSRAKQNVADQKSGKYLDQEPHPDRTFFGLDVSQGYTSKGEQADMDASKAKNNTHPDSVPEGVMNTIKTGSKIGGKVLGKVMGPIGVISDASDIYDAGKWVVNGVKKAADKGLRIGDPRRSEPAMAPKLSMKPHQTGELPVQEDNDEEHQKELDKTGYWGKAGAGCIIMAQDTKRILLPLRSEWVQEPSTWGTWGGAIDHGENPKESVLREIEEEAGYNGDILDMILLYTYKDDDFRYDTFVVVIPTEFEPQLNWETKSTRWVEFGEWPKPLHFGLETVFKDGPAMNKLGMLTSD